MVRRPRIVVIGAGIAGLTVAAALSRVGLHCRVFEQAECLRAVGAGVQVAPNASRLLHRLGLGTYLSEVAVRPSALELRHWADGRLLARLALGDRCEEMYGAPYYTTHRADLQAGLLQLVPPDRIGLGCQCIAIDESHDAVSVHFADSRVVTGDLVVGADGIHSTVRNALVGDAPRFSGQTAYRGLVETQELDVETGEPAVTVWPGPGQHCVMYPVSGGDLVNLVATTPAGECGAESWSARGRVSDLTAAYVGWHERVTRTMSAVTTVNRSALYDRDRVQRWSTDRITLVGDAAHPMLPFAAQGANQAIEDALALAACVATAEGDGVAGALRRYERSRLTRTSQVQQLSRDQAMMLHREGRGRDGRGGVDPVDALRASARLYGYDAEWAAKQHGTR